MTTLTIIALIGTAFVFFFLGMFCGYEPGPTIHWQSPSPSLQSAQGIYELEAENQRLIRELSLNRIVSHNMFINRHGHIEAYESLDQMSAEAIFNRMASLEDFLNVKYEPAKTEEIPAKHVKTPKQ